MRELPDFLTVREVAEVFRISPTTAYKEVERCLDTGGREGIPVLLSSEALWAEAQVPLQRVAGVVPTGKDHGPYRGVP